MINNSLKSIKVNTKLPIKSYNLIARFSRIVGTLIDW